MRRFGLSFSTGGLVLVACAAWGTSCGGTVVDDSLPIALSDFDAAWAAAVCAGEGPCCQAAGVPFDGPSCIAVASERQRAYDERRMNGHARYDPVAARTCINAWNDLARSCGPLSLAQRREIGAACAPVFTGIQPDGAVCAGDADCASGASSCAQGPQGPQCSPVLIAANHGTFGAPCALTCASSDCNVGNSFGKTEIVGCYLDDGLSCGASQTCAAPGQLGEACAFGSCAPGAFCEAGLCARLRDNGPCNDTDLREACSAASYCADGQCQRKLPNGSPCSSTDACQGQCDLPVGVNPDSSKRAPVPGECTDKRFATRQHCAGEL